MKQNVLLTCHFVCRRHLVSLTNLKPVNPVPAWNITPSRKSNSYSHAEQYPGELGDLFSIYKLQLNVIYSRIFLVDHLISVVRWVCIINVNTFTVSGFSTVLYFRMRLLRKSGLLFFRFKILIILLMYFIVNACLAQTQRCVWDADFLKSLGVKRC